MRKTIAAAATADPGGFGKFRKAFKQAFKKNELHNMKCAVYES